MRRLRWRLILVVFCLLAVGYVFLYSSSAVYYQNLCNDSFYLLKKQILATIIGGVLAFICFLIDLEKLRKKSRVIIILAIFSLLTVLLFGKEVGGSKRWIKIFNFSFQPVEFVKIALCFYLADFIERKKFQIKSFFKVVLPPLIIAGILVLLLLKQPDIGSSFFILFITVFFLYFGGVRLKYLTFIILSFLIFSPVLIYKFHYLKARLISFLNPWQNYKTIGFQLIQSYLAIGSGGILGRGLGLSRQKLFFLPASYNDFIFSIIGEETGFLGASFVVFLYVAFIFLSIEIIKRRNSTFLILFGSSLVALIAFQSFVNIAVCIGILPTKGLPLPFISYGGSSLVANLMIVGLLLNISKTPSPEEDLE